MSDLIDQHPHFWKACDVKALFHPVDVAGILETPYIRMLCLIFHMGYERKCEIYSKIS